MQERTPGRRSDAFHGSIDAPARLCGDFAGIGVKADLPHGSSADASPQADAAASLRRTSFQPCLPRASRFCLTRTLVHRSGSGRAKE